MKHFFFLEPPVVFFLERRVKFFGLPTCTDHPLLNVVLLASEVCHFLVHCFKRTDDSSN